MVLALTGPEPGELAPPELEMLSRSLMGTLLKLARERDLGAQVGGGRPRNRRTMGSRHVGKGALGSRCGAGAVGLGSAGLQQPDSTWVTGDRCGGPGRGCS